MHAYYVYLGSCRGAKAPSKLGTFLPATPQVAYLHAFLIVLCWELLWQLCVLLKNIIYLDVLALLYDSACYAM